MITSLTPSVALAGEVIPSLQVTGLNLGGSSFVFVPELDPVAIAIDSIAIDPEGMSAQLSVTIDSAAEGPFALVATNGLGSSSSFLTIANTLAVLDPAADADGDGLSNEDEIMLHGTNPLLVDSDGDGFIDSEDPDPLDPDVFPDTSDSLTRQAVALTISVLNESDATLETVSTRSAVARTASVLNEADATNETVTTRSAAARTVSVLNEVDATQETVTTRSAAARTVSVLNEVDATQETVTTREAFALPVSVENTAAP